MKKTFLIILLLSGFTWAQSQLILPEVEKSLSPSPKPQTPGLLLPLQLPEVQATVSLPPREQMPTLPPLNLPQVSPKDLTVGTDRFDGGLNMFFPTDRLAPNQAQKMINFLPCGNFWLEKREGFQKIQYTSLGVIYGLSMVDSAGAKTRLIAVGDNDLYYTDTLYAGTYVDFGNTTAEPTFFVSTPFGLVISNDGSDSCRIWDGVSSTSIKALGECDTGTVDADSTYTNGDTAWVADSSAFWAVDYWIGYWAQCGTLSTSLFKIIDSGVNWLDLVDCADTCDDSTFVILARPDSVSGGLTYPKGQATAYYQDRLFVSSAYYPHRIYYSEPRLIDDIPPDHIINLDMGTQDKIQRMVSFNGYLIPFGSNSIYVINSSLQAFLVTNTIGCSAPKSIAVGDDYVYFVSQPTGVYRFNSNIFASISYKPEKISDPIQNILAGVGADVLDGACGIYINRQYWLAYSPDSCLVFDERTEQWYQQGLGFTEALPLIGDFRMQGSEILYPDADGDTTDWASTGGNHYGEIDDRDDDADYISASHGQIDKVGFGNLANYPTGAEIQAIDLYLRGWKTIGGTAEVWLDVAANGQGYRIVNIGLTVTATTYHALVTENPVTGDGWTQGDLDSLKMRIYGYLHPGIRVSGLWIIPTYRSTIPIRDFVFSTTSKDYIYQYGGVSTDDTSGTGTYNVTGKAIIATYQSGEFDAGSPVNQKIMRKFFIETEKDTGQVNIYIYKDFETTAIDTQEIYKDGKRTDLFYLPATVAGKKFSIKVETTSDVDSLIIKRWSGLIIDLGKRK